MKVDISKKSPYLAVIDLIREMTKENGYECMFDRIVRIRTTTLGESNEQRTTNSNKTQQKFAPKCTLQCGIL